VKCARCPKSGYFLPGKRVLQRAIGAQMPFFIREVIAMG
jgi:hypothetical protein